ncbi:MAG: thiamine ABC transporter substrate binding subunit [Geminicoccaceae bacterium]
MSTLRIKPLLAAGLLGAGLALATLPVKAEDGKLTIYTYDSFASEWGPGPVVEKAFEAECGCDLEFVALDSSIGILGRVQIEGETSPADIVLGLDTNLMAVAEETGLFQAHGVEAGDLDMPIDWADPTFLPFDWGYFAFVYHEDKLKSPPSSMAELLALPEEVRIVIQDPRSATPGLGLLLWMKAVYGEDAGGAWQKLAPKVMTVTKGWWDAYSLFLEGEADMVLSYATSPAYHVINEERTDILAAAFEEGHYLQVEVAAVLRNSPNPERAKEFMAFMLSPAFQDAIPTTNWMMPAKGKALPPEFDQLIQPAETLSIPPEEIAANRKVWTGEWLEALGR